jgi:hypothetical protein
MFHNVQDNLKAYIGVADTAYIVADAAIANGAATIAAQPDFPRNITITVTDANTSISAGTVTVTGKDLDGSVISESLNLAVALTKTGTKNFKSITSVVVAGLVGNGAGDNLKVGIGSNVQLTYGRTTFVKALVGGGAGQVGKYQIIDGTSGTTTNVAELKQTIGTGTYDYYASINSGLRVIISGATPITIIYNQ